ncbi:MAG TPA: glycerol kinase GlpK, partial [Sphingomicrobium sp.]|nr:glycerol kinase GlpK [Sphingomicrobium sp.]
AIDQGTTSTRAIIVDSHGRAVASAQRELEQHYPAPGSVEHDPEQIWQDTLACIREVLAAGSDKIAAIGITNQRETVLVWDRATGEPIHPAIVWQDRRTSELVALLRQERAEPLIRARTGLLLDPYFSATKIAWILDHVEGARTSAERGKLACGTIDCFLLYRLTGGRVHSTDATNACRTSLFDIHRQCWDAELCGLFRVPQAMLPDVHDNSHRFGTTAPGLFDEELPISGMAGDQHAALFGQACFSPGMVKSTYGTGCFMLANIGTEPTSSEHRLLTTIAYRLAGKATYALEGSIFVAGAAIKWLRDGLGVIANPEETDNLAMCVPESHGITMVPAFVGLGAPYWDPDARGAIFGLTLDATGAHLARAALEAVAYQCADLVEAMAKDGVAKFSNLRVDGGMAANSWLCQFLADILRVPVERPRNVETTALGAAFLAGLEVGLWGDLDALARTWKLQDRFEPLMPARAREARIAGWRRAVEKVVNR